MTVTRGKKRKGGRRVDREGDESNERREEGREGERRVAERRREGGRVEGKKRVELPV